MREGDLIRFNS